jgi:hypothetical protein
MCILQKSRSRKAQVQSAAKPFKKCGTQTSPAHAKLGKPPAKHNDLELWLVDDPCHYNWGVEITGLRHELPAKIIQNSCRIAWDTRMLGIEANAGSGCNLQK